VHFYCKLKHDDKVLFATDLRPLMNSIDCMKECEHNNIQTMAETLSHTDS